MGTPTPAPALVVIPDVLADALAQSLRAAALARLGNLLLSAVVVVLVVVRFF